MEGIPGAFNSLEKPLDPESVLDSQYLKIRVLRVLRVLRDSDNSTIEWPWKVFSCQHWRILLSDKKGLLFSLVRSIMSIYCPIVRFL